MDGASVSPTARTAGLSRDAVKYLAMVAMLLNHVATIFLEPGTALFVVLVDIGYFTAVTMCYFLVEGYRHTRSRRRYGGRLLLFAALSELPYCLAFSTGRRLEFTGLNMLFTLFFCFLILEALERIPNRALKVLAVLALTAVTGFCDWAFLAAAYTVLFYVLRGSRTRVAVAYGAAAALLGAFCFPGLAASYPAGKALGLTLCACAGIAASGVVILCCYSGRRAARGRTFSKWFFYAFYPAHLLVLGLLRLWL